jgi:hypothetical protein
MMVEHGFPWVFYISIYDTISYHFEMAVKMRRFASGIAAPDAGVFCICEWYARHSQARAVAAKASAN